MANNFILAMMKAVSKDQSTLSQMQIVDANSTMLATKIEENIYEYWNGPHGPLARDEGKISDYAGSSHKDASNEVTKWQTQYSEDSAKAQQYEQQQDGNVQSAQGQTSSDATNLQMKAQMVQGLNSILSTTSSLLNQGITA